MREIKYRFFRTRLKEMVYGFTGCSTTYVLSLWENEKHVSEPMQYTGLKDNNGAEIYEGDIIEYKWMDNPKKLLVVEWNGIDACYNFGHIRTDYVINYGEVVGNIYENPDLL